MGLLSPLGPPAAQPNPVLNHCIQAGAFHIIYLHVLQNTKIGGQPLSPRQTPQF